MPPCKGNHGRTRTGIVHARLGLEVRKRKRGASVLVCGSFVNRRQPLLSFFSHAEARRRGGKNGRDGLRPVRVSDVGCRLSCGGISTRKTDATKRVPPFAFFVHFVAKKHGLEQASCPFYYGADATKRVPPDHPLFSVVLACTIRGCPPPLLFCFSPLDIRGKCMLTSVHVTGKQRTIEA